MVIDNGWRYYTPVEVAHAASISVRRVYRMIRAGRLEAMRAKPKARFFIAEDDIQRVFGDVGL
jgi:predicted site-specific integrase-resolvase